MDLMPTFLESFGLPVPAEVQGSSLLPLLAARCGARDVGIFGMFGGPIGATDGRYAYYLYPEDLYAPGLHEYTLMPMHIHSLFSAPEMQTAALVPPFDFTKDMPVMRIDALKDARRIPIHDNKLFDPDVGTTLYDLATDPRQQKPFRDAAIERRFLAGIAQRAGGARRAGRDLRALRRQAACDAALTLVDRASCITDPEGGEHAMMKRAHHHDDRALLSRPRSRSPRRARRSRRSRSPTSASSRRSRS